MARLVAREHTTSPRQKCTLGDTDSMRTKQRPARPFITYKLHASKGISATSLENTEFYVATNDRCNMLADNNFGPTAGWLFFLASVAALRTGINWHGQRWLVTTTESMCYFRPFNGELAGGQAAGKSPHHCL